MRKVNICIGLTFIIISSLILTTIHPAPFTLWRKNKRSDTSLRDKGGITYIKVINYPGTGLDRCIKPTEETRDSPPVGDLVLLGAEQGENICYAQYKPYVLSTTITSTDGLSGISELKIHLDYKVTNITLCYNWTRSVFSKTHDILDRIILNPDSCNASNNGLDRWNINFSIMFNFSFPHEMLMDSIVNITEDTGENVIKFFKDVLRVENDLEFKGTDRFLGEIQGSLDQGDWIKGGENITVSDLNVTYEDAPEIKPNANHFDVKIEDIEGNTWFDQLDGTGEVVVNIEARNESDLNERFKLSIVNIPGNGQCVGNVIFPVRIDATPPGPPLNILCRADSFNDTKTDYTDQFLTYVTWDEAEDSFSGLKGYYFSLSDNSGTSNGTMTNDTRVVIHNLAEGFVTVYLWCVDNVGNIGKAATSGIFVDIMPPIFSNFAPEADSWQNNTDVKCSVEIQDVNGSGIDGKSIEYAISTKGRNGFGDWIPHPFPHNYRLLNPSVKCSFLEGELNYIKWRAKDLADNGFPETSPIKIKVDTTPIEFKSDISPHIVWHKSRIITTKIAVYDRGSGVDIDSLEARISVSGPWKFTQWMDIERENITKLEEGKYEISLTFSYKEGRNNYIMFRGTDNAINPFNESDKINLMVDSKPVYFGEGKPRPDEYSNELKVECIITIMDEGSGVDPDTVEYSTSTIGPEEENFVFWIKPINVIPGNPTQALVEIEYNWGRDNYIRWRANDRIDTGLNTSKPFQIWINSKPIIAISSPTPSVVHGEGKEILFDASDSYDVDGDNLTFHWLSNQTTNLSLGSGSIVRAKLPEGVHTITLVVSDGHGYNVSEFLYLNVSDGTASNQNEGILGWLEDSVGIGLWPIIVMAILLICSGMGIYYLKVKKREEKEIGSKTPKKGGREESRRASPKKRRSERSTPSEQAGEQPSRKKKSDGSRESTKKKQAEKHPPPLPPPPKPGSTDNDQTRLIQLIGSTSTKKEK